MTVGRWHPLDRFDALLSSDEPVCDVLRRLRLGLGWTCEDMAAATGIGERNLRDYMSGRVSPSMRVMREIRAAVVREIERRVQKGHK